MKRDKRLLILILLTLLLTALFAGTAQAAAYRDVPADAWYAEAVSYVSDNGLMTGVSDTSFAPEATVTRGMIVTILYREAGSPACVGKADFSDVAEGAWYAEAVEWGAETGLVTGYGNGCFGPEDPVTREQLARILRQYAKMQGADVTKSADLTQFKDASSVSGWAKEALSWAVAEGLVGGVGGDMLAPAGQASRAETAAILMRLLDKEPAGLTLLKSVSIYDWDYAGGDWVLARTISYEYENGYPVKMDVYYPDSDEHSIATFEYSFENGLPVTGKEYDAEGKLQKTRLFEKGRISEILTGEAGSESFGRTMYQYANGDAWFTLQLSSTVYDNFTMEEVDSVQVTAQNGLLVKTVNSGLYANWNEGEEKEWMRFNGTYTANYDGDGILSGTSSVFRAGPDGGEDHFALTREKGRVKEAVRSLQYPGQEPMLTGRCVFEYTDVPVDPARYANMINEHLIGAGNNYYRYYWY